jgi:hypothetical protein
MMKVYECPHCGFVTKEVAFKSCPGCGCDAAAEYLEVPQADVPPDDGRREDYEKRKYGGLSFEDQEVVPFKVEDTTETSMILSISQALDHPLCPLVRKWYGVLDEKARRGYDRKVSDFIQNWAQRGIAELRARERDIAFRKILEVVAANVGMSRRRASCRTCTYYLGEMDCDIEDILKEHGAITETDQPSGPRSICKFYAEQIDLDSLSRRLRFRLKSLS